MKIWMFALITFLVVSISQADISEPYTVRVQIDEKGKFTLYTIHSISDFAAMTYVEAEMRLNSFIPNVQNVTVEKTGLDFSKAPVIQFEIIGTKGDRIIPLHTIDSRLGILAIQHALNKHAPQVKAGIGEIEEIRVTDDFLFEANHPLLTCSGFFRG